MTLLTLNVCGVEVFAPLGALSLYTVADVSVRDAVSAV